MHIVETNLYFSSSVVYEPDTVAVVANSNQQIEPQKSISDKKRQEKSQPIQTAKYNYFLYEKNPDDTIVPEATQWAPISMDSVFAAYESPEPVWHKSLFTECKMQPIDSKPSSQVDTYTACWTFVLFSGIITIISLYANNHRFMYGDIFLSAFSVRSMTRILRDCNINRESSLTPMTLIYAMGMSLSGLFVAVQYSFWMPFQKLPMNFLALFATFFTYLLIKNRLMALIGNLFESKSAMMLYNQNTHVYNFLAGLLLAPLALVMFFNEGLSHTCFMILVSLIATLFILRLLRGMKFVLSNTHHARIYLIYYLLVFEVVPLIVLGKTFLLF